MQSLIAWMRRPRCIHVTVERYNLKRQDTQNIRQAREGRDEELWNRHRKLMLNPNQRRFMKKKERLIMSRKMKELRE